MRSGLPVTLAAVGALAALGAVASRRGSRSMESEAIINSASVLDEYDFSELKKLFRRAGRSWGFTFDGYLYHGTTAGAWSEVQSGTQILHLTADRSFASEFTGRGSDGILLRIPLAALVDTQFGPDENLLVEEGETDPLVSARKVGHVTIVGDIESLKPQFSKVDP